jgi:hypothetical protein
MRGPMAATDHGLYVYLGVLWVAFFGMVAFGARSPITKRAKILGALTFVLLIVDASGLLRGLEV